jgi:tetratricopeptide (TPR) repeat protein
MTRFPIEKTMGLVPAAVVISAVLSLACRTLPAQTASSHPASVDDLYAAAQEAQSRNDLDAAIRDYQELIRVSPGTAAAYNNLGSIYYDHGDYRKAIDTLQTGLRINPRMAASHAILASAFLAVGDAKHAIDQFSIAVRQNPEDKRSEDMLEQTLIAQHEYAQATERLEARVARNPSDQDAWYRLGRLRLQQSQQAFEQVDKIAPDSPLAHELHGELQEDLGHLQDAQQQYEVAVKQAPDKPGTHEHLGNVFWLQGLWAPAEQEFRAELRNDPDSCQAHWKLADAILNANEDSSEALNEAHEAIRRCPGLMQARVDRARALVNLNRGPEASEDLQMAEKQNPEEPQIHFLLMKIFRAQGKTTEANEEKTKFSELVDRNKNIPSVPQPSTP